MNFLKSLLIKIKAKTTLRTYQKPLLVTIIALLIINFIILFLGAFIGYVIDNKYYNQEFFSGSFLGAFVTSIKWMISPTTIISYDASKHLRMLIVAAIVVVIEMVLFSGAIVAMVTTSLRRYIDVKSKAKGKIVISEHFVILNWNSKVPDIIYNLMQKGFKNNIVILSNQNKEYIESELKSLLLANDVTSKAKAHLIVKEGNPLLRGNLEDISITKAAHICVMVREDMPDNEDDDILNSDLFNLKITLRLGSFDINPNCQIVVETDSDATRSQIDNLALTVHSLKDKHIIPVSFNKKIGQIIAQTIIEPILSDVYLELFSFDGSEFYSVKTEDTIEEFMKYHNSAIPVADMNNLFVLAENEKEYLKKREKLYSITDKFTKVSDVVKEVVTIFVIGENKKSEFILENLNRSKNTTSFTYEIKDYKKTENERLIKDIEATPGEKKVLILSDDTVSEDSYDANVFVTLIELSKAFPNRENITYITELLDSRNLSSVRDFDIHNTIISNRMMSLLMSQLAMNQESKIFFDKLLTVDLGVNPEDFDIVATRVADMIVVEDKIELSSKAELLHKFYNTYDGKNILIGLEHEGELSFLNSNQDKQEKITIYPDDSFVFIEY